MSIGASALVACASSKADPCPAVSYADLPPTIVRAALPDSLLDASEKSGLMFVVVAAGSRRAIRSASVVMTRNGAVTGTITDSVGAARVIAPAPGSYSIALRRLGYARRLDTVEVRAGYSDTLRAQLREDRLCLGRVTVD